jgi:ribonucleotide reductase alpha subunit
MIKQYVKLKRITPIEVNKSYDFAVQDSHRIIARKKRTNLGLYTSNCWHPDIEEFIVAKQTQGRLTKFNLSIGITSGFMEAVQNNKMWTLKFPDTGFEKYETEWKGDLEEWELKGYPVNIYKEIKAKKLWDMIMISTYNRNEPGVLFLDLANKLNTIPNKEKVQTSNPCVSGDTLIAVADERNAVPIKQLAEENKETPVYSVSNGKVVIKTATKIFKTKKNAELLKIILDDDSELKCTPEHKIMLRNGEYVEACNLKENDSLMPFNSYISNIGYRQISSNIGRDKCQYRMIDEDNGLIVGSKKTTIHHKVKKIGRVNNEDVYDMVVPDTNNFGIITSYNDKRYITSSGIFIHNCGEVLMSTGCCNLGSINVVKFITKSTNENEFGIFDYNKFQSCIQDAVRFLDNINDISTTPLPEYDKSLKEKRRIGLGIMGLGSAHFMLGIRYGSEESIDFINKLFKIKCESELLASAKIGKEKGSFELFDKNDYFGTYWWKTLNISNEIKNEIEQIGCMRNSHRSANAPNGNGSIFAGVVSGGIEPVFMKEYVRWSMISDNDKRELINNGIEYPNILKNEWYETKDFVFSKRGDEQILKGTINGINYEIDKNRGITKSTDVIDYGYQWLLDNFSEKKINMLEINGKLATTTTLTTQEHINALKTLAPWVDLNSSKTVNLPNNYSYNDFKNLYMDAW